jgi:hypothetical protein
VIKEGLENHVLTIVLASILFEDFLHMCLHELLELQGHHFVPRWLLFLLLFRLFFLFLFL